MEVLVRLGRKETVGKGSLVARRLMVVKYLGKWMVGSLQLLSL